MQLNCRVADGDIRQHADAGAITVVRDVLFLSVQVTTMMDVLSAADHSVAKSVGSGLSQK